MGYFKRVLTSLESEIPIFPCYTSYFFVNESMEGPFLLCIKILWSCILSRAQQLKIQLDLLIDYLLNTY